MDRLLSALGMSGIGGKISSGYGSFTVEERIDLCAPFDAQTEWLHDALEKRDAKHQLLLTTSLPADDELEDALEGAQYQLVRRAGMCSPTHSPSRRSESARRCLWPPVPC